MANKKVAAEHYPTRHITGRETLLLWVRSGGRCVMCNKYLLEEPYYERPINLAERAHIAGWKDASGSPRGDSNVPVPDRNKANNLILLCQDCHTVVDHVDTRAEFPEERLIELKQAHEDRIFHLTAMSHDRETAVLRVFGAVRGSIPEMAREQAMRTVVDGAGRYARFPLAIDRHSIEIDLSQLPDPETVGNDAYWQVGRAQIDSVMARVAEGVHKNHVRHLSIFALARIPLLVYFGYALDDKVPVDLYQKHRGKGEGWMWPEIGPAALFQIVQHRVGSPDSDVVVILSISGTVPLADLPPDTEGLAVFEIRSADDVIPNPNLIRSSATLDSFVRTYQDLLSQLEQTNKRAENIHLFPAIPITAAIACGRHIMRHVHPALKIYDRIGNEFRYALTVNQS